MGRRSKPPRRSRPAPQRHYQRTARLNPLIQQIVAEYFEEVEDSRLGLLTITGVEVDADLNTAQVYVSYLDGEIKSVSEIDEGRDAVVLEALEEHRREVRLLLGRSARLRKTPDVVFGFDPAVRAGAKIDELLSGIDQTTSEYDDSEYDDSEYDDSAGAGLEGADSKDTDLEETVSRIGVEATGEET